MRLELVYVGVKGWHSVSERTGARLAEVTSDGDWGVGYIGAGFEILDREENGSRKAKLRMACENGRSSRQAGQPGARALGVMTDCNVYRRREGKVLEGGWRETWSGVSTASHRLHAISWAS